MPGYLHEEGLDGKMGGVYNTVTDAATGVGEYALSSGGGTNDHLNGMVGDKDGNIYDM